MPAGPVPAARRCRVRLLAPVLAAAAVVAIGGAVVTRAPAASGGAAGAPGEPPLSAAAAAPDVEQRLARWKPVAMPFDAAGLTARERQLVDKLVLACRRVEDIYWRQSDPQALALYQALAGRAGAASRGEDALRRLLWINASRFDLLDDNRPFVGPLPMPPGRALYPRDLTRAEIETYVAAHPAARDGIFSQRTVVRRQGARLVAVPYHVAYRALLEPAAAALREAAALAADPAFAGFLRLRAEALLSDRYGPSDRAWMAMADPKIDLILAPYQTYLDDLLGVKGSYGAAVLIRDDALSDRLSAFQQYVPRIQDSLPLPPPDRPPLAERAAPVEVVDSPFRAGDLRHGTQLVAQVHERRGSKEVFFKNFLDARLRQVIQPLAQRVMRGDQARQVTADAYLTVVMTHEIGHRLGPRFGRRNGRLLDIGAAIGPTYAALEEAKADAAGMLGLAWLVRHGALPQARLEEYYCSFAASAFRALRFGAGEAHGRAQTMELVYLLERQAIVRDAATGLYQVDLGRMPGAVEALARELLEIEATADRARAETWFAIYADVPLDLESTLAAAGVPVGIDPRDAFGDEVR
ncbi:MAG: Zn-dependent hydrolase [Acidobacteria bacterium]|nr:Zn-dependent hydrolase [Acidobacteriota bacterium]